MLQRLLSASLLFLTTTTVNAQTISSWLTNNDKSALFSQQKTTLSFKAGNSVTNAIKVDPTKTFQSMDGFGFALTGGSAQHIIHMSAAARQALLKHLFDTTGNSIGVSYIRLSIGASDLNQRIFSYDDQKGTATDPTLTSFDLADDKADVIPVMKEILAINPHIKILGSPWSPPAWMKTNNDTRGGMLMPAYYHAYAQYFANYITAMAKEGITIDAITVQNEPLHPGNNPSLLMTAPDMADFIKNHLGPIFKSQNISTKIITYDHNADRPDYPISILDDEAARQYVDGSAFHLYNGKIDALTDVHDAYPAKNVYFTEQMVVQFNRREGDDKKINIASPVTRLMIGAPRNWSKNVLLWNLAANSKFEPYTDRGGCDMCQGAVSVDGDSVSYNLAYYTMAHLSKLVRPGSVRIASSETDSLSSVAFTTPSGNTVLVVSNNGRTQQNFSISYKGKNATAFLKPRSVATYSWK